MNNKDIKWLLTVVQHTAGNAIARINAIANIRINIKGGRITSIRHHIEEVKQNPEKQTNNAR